MNEQLKENLVGYLDALATRVKAGSDFVSDETPNLVREWVWWQVIENGIWAGVCLMMSVACVWAFRRMRGFWTEFSLDDDPPLVLGLLLLLVIGGLGAFGFMHFGVQCAKAAVAPRVVVVEKVTELTGLSR